MNANLRLSTAGANLIKHFESCLRPVGGGRFKAYLDPVKVLTIGWGHTNHHGRKFKSGAIWTQKECDDEFISDMKRFEAAVKRLVKVPLTQYQFDPLVSFSFNVGEGNLSRSTMLRMINAKNFAGAAQEFKRFNKAKGKVLKGLVRRRGSEALMFQNIPDPGYTGKPGQRVAPRVEMVHEVDEPEEIDIISEAMLEPDEVDTELVETPPVEISPTPASIQRQLIALGYLDPPADGIIGSVTNWALRECGIREDVTAENADAILRRLHERVPLPLIPGNDLAGKIIAAMHRNGYWVARHSQCLNIVYVEGMDHLTGKPNKNEPDKWNDVRFLIRVENGVPKIIGRWDATTEPGKYWTQRPMNKRGAARLAFGQFKAWSLGTHKTKDHPALVQTRPLPVYRDLKKLFKRYGNQHVGLFGINQHWGYDLKHSLGRSSAGCLVGRTRAGHRSFMASIRKDARVIAAGGGYRFMTTLMPAADVVK